MPTRTMLPPNLTRHFYETRRAFLRSAGQDATPWFQLSPMERTVVEGEMELFRQAIRSAEEEQDLLASLDATRAAAATDEETPTEEKTADGEALEDCCLGCAAVSAFLALIEEVAAEPSSKEPGPNSFPFDLLTVTTAGDGRPISLERLLVKDFPADDFRAEFWLRKPPTVDKA
ncbi:hypothetical protein ACPCAG_30800 [Streptomyces pseudogriseolus]|uniref:hypothetical protein n=1 Tax=Streptomyces pseudogriseolus TaxID=36817 RepID=UPI003FA306EC